MLAIATIDGVEISEPRLRLPPNGRDVTAGYLTLTNGSDKAQKLVGASSPKAERIELHAHLKGADGMAQMRQVQQVEIPAKGTAVLAPGGLHLMVFGIKEPLKPGDSFPVELTFEGNRKVGFAMPVVENPTSQVEGDKAQAGHQH
jgi:copper(I)-binding protein